ncbi:hypothetical protein, partial [Staphylococcus aureus]
DFLDGNIFKIKQHIALTMTKEV